VTLGLLGADAAAFVPKIEKITQQVAAANRRAERDHELVLSVVLRDRDDRKLAQGELLSDPRGLARLELSDGGTLERHVLRGGNHMAARGGELLSGPSPYLPPLFLLQAGSGSRVLSGLLSLGGSGEETVLGRHEGEVCYVLGGRDLAPPANESAAAFGSAGPKAAVWVTRDDWRIVRIDGADGTRWVLGPLRELGETTLPEWVRIERPGVPTVRLEILGARRGRFDPATTFGSDWLLGR
jgi:hypothetical protein